MASNDVCEMRLVMAAVLTTRGNPSNRFPVQHRDAHHTAIGPLLLPTLLAGRRGKARTRARAARLLTAAGLRAPHWHRLYAVIIQAVAATK